MDCEGVVSEAGGRAVASNCCKHLDAGGCVGTGHAHSSKAPGHHSSLSYFPIHCSAKELDC